MRKGSDQHCHFAALLLRPEGRPRPDTLQQRLAGWLDEIGQQVTAAGALPDGAVWLRTAQATVQLDAAGAARLELRVAERTTDAAGAAGELILLHLTYRLSARLSPERIEWQAPGAWLDTRAFMDVAAQASGRVRPVRPGMPARAAPRRLRPSPRSGRGPEAVLDLHLREALREAPEAGADDADTAHAAEETVPGRLAAWALSVAAALLYLPLAPVLFAVNLRHGPGLRLPAQALSVLGLFLALDQAGALARLAALAPV